ncbi:MAG: hypothetical protein MUC92_01415 [Fimbriimonadaceae bacterium]|jgi:hypothetical protein|nr:hypothetical protein [Fimbriimonadaceae bacterium]
MNAPTSEPASYPEGLGAPPKKRAALGAILLMAFFLGFPVAGLLYFWGDMHNKLNSSAKTYIHETIPKVFQGFTRDDYFNETNATFRRNNDEASWERLRQEWAGATFGQVTIKQTFAREREDMAMQFAKATAPISLGDKSATVNLGVSRPTNAPRWRIEFLEIVEVTR